MSPALHLIVGLLHIWPLASVLATRRDMHREWRRVGLPRVSAQWLLEFEIASSKHPDD
jgi:hypothetical protein